ncbi:hypothetical protein KFF05_03880 [bacterium SCSIO 12827]|nr:hypothetical protein KFF05_03880 [bacterium SCSIO 12827]
MLQMMQVISNLPAKRLLLVLVLVSITVLNATAFIGVSDEGNAGELVFAAHLGHPETENQHADEHDDSCHFLTHHLTWCDGDKGYATWLDSEDAPETILVSKAGLASFGFYRPPII